MMIELPDGSLRLLPFQWILKRTVKSSTDSWHPSAISSALPDDLTAELDEGFSQVQG